MKRSKSFMAFMAMGVALVLSLGSCMDASLSQSGTAATSLSVQQVPDGISAVELTIDGPGMSQISTTINIDTDAVVIEVPVGPDRVFEAKAGDYTARAVRDVPAGGIQISLRFSTGVIMFSANWDGDYDIYTVTIGGGGEPEALTANSVDDDGAQYTPDGSRIVFERYAGSDFDIYSMNSDGTNQTRLTSTSGFYYTWTVSPDSQTVAFFADLDADGDDDIYTVPVSGGTETRLVENTAGTTGGSQLRWSPDGSKLLYHADFDGNGFDEMGVVDSDGSNRATLFEESADTTTNTTLNRSFWLGEGANQLAYNTSTYDNVTFTTTYSITAISADPQAPNEQIIHTTTDAYLSTVMPSFSGESILFIGDVNGSPEVFVDSVAGGTATQLTSNVLDESFAFWLPGDELIAVQLGFEPPSGFLIGSAGGGFEIAADLPGDILAGWSPDGNTVVFIRDETGDPFAGPQEEVLYSVDVASGVGAPRPVFANQGEGNISSVQWRP